MLPRGQDGLVVHSGLGRERGLVGHLRRDGGHLHALHHAGRRVPVVDAVVVVVVEVDGQEARVVRQRLILCVALAAREVGNVILQDPVEGLGRLLAVERFDGRHLRVAALARLVVLLRVAQLARQLLVERLLALETLAQLVHPQLHLVGALSALDEPGFLLLDLGRLLFVHLVAILTGEKRKSSLTVCTERQ